MSNQHSDPAQLAVLTVVPTAMEAEGGVMPGASESISAGAYPRPDATRPATLPRAVAESMGDPTSNRNREQLLAVAQDQGIDGAGTLSRGELADVLTATIPPTDLDDALTT